MCSTFCRELVTKDGRPSIFTTDGDGKLSVRLEAHERPLDLSLRRLVAIPKDDFNVGLLKSHVQCVRVNGE
jgi:hypothetical protein